MRNHATYRFNGHDIDVYHWPRGKVLPMEKVFVDDRGTRFGTFKGQYFCSDVGTKRGYYPRVTGRSISIMFGLAKLGRSAAFPLKMVQAAYRLDKEREDLEEKARAAGYLIETAARAGIILPKDKIGEAQKIMARAKKLKDKHYGD